jgi:CO dehydrogenase/acetyl-CoA synthase gamma subunit (corrinoid Fe-S protein)
MASSVEAVFAELGMTQYLDVFLEQGFDTWETILDITESDLYAMGAQ